MAGSEFDVGECEEISVGLVAGQPLCQIARRLDRPVSTACRDVARCAGGRHQAVIAHCRPKSKARGRPSTPRPHSDSANWRSPTRLQRTTSVAHATRCELERVITDK